MGLLPFAKKWLNVIMGIAMIIVTLLSRFVVPPYITPSFSQGQINYEIFSKFVVTAIILLILVPCILYKERKYFAGWYFTGVIFFILALALFFFYSSLVDSKTVYDRYKQKRFVAGQTLLPIIQLELDSIAKREPGKVLSRQDILESAGSADDIWSHTEIESNAQQLSACYIVTISGFTIFILCLFQSLHCLSPKTQTK
jgi:hypothetical protein